jgi:hypothetical protein
LISLTHPVPVPNNQFWFQWHFLCQAPIMNFDFNDILCQSPRIKFDFIDTSCASPQESNLISLTHLVPAPNNQFWFHWHILCQYPRIKSIHLFPLWNFVVCSKDNFRPTSFG